MRVPRLAAFTRTYIMPRSVTTQRPSPITFQLSHNFWKMSAVPTRKIPSEGGKALKLACATCIQGHRASSCKHQDGSKGPLLVVKRRGRPLSQCQECRERRLLTGRHTRCDCKKKEKKTAEPSEERPMKRRVNNSSTPIDLSSRASSCKQGPLSFEFLLNPCKCEDGTICVCCRSPYDDQKLEPITSCYKENFANIAPTLPKEQSSNSCCVPPSIKLQDDVNRSMKLLAKAADMSRSYTPECQCIGPCRCKGCLGHDSKYNQAELSDAPTCKTCVACDISMENPTGIDTIDRWDFTDASVSSQRFAYDVK